MKYYADGEDAFEMHRDLKPFLSKVLPLYSSSTLKYEEELNFYRELFCSMQYRPECLQPALQLSSKSYTHGTSAKTSEGIPTANEEVPTNINAPAAGTLIDIYI